MTTNRTDLLNATRILLTFGMSVVIVAMVGAALALVMGHGSGPRALNPPLLPPEQMLFAARTYRAVQLLGGALGIPVLWLLRAIVDSARLGDPFIPENATRLRRIGWLILAANFVFFAASFLLPPSYQDQVNAYPGVLTAVLVFVLARIFDTGARMRTEIRETI